MRSARVTALAVAAVTAVSLDARPAPLDALAPSITPAIGGGSDAGSTPAAATSTR